MLAFLNVDLLNKYKPNAQLMIVETKHVLITKCRVPIHDDRFSGKSASGGRHKLCVRLLFDHPYTML